MKIKFEIPYSHFVVLDVDQDSGVLLKALANSSLVTESGYGADKEWKAAEAHQRIAFEVLPDGFAIKPHDAIEKLTKDNAHATRNWLKAASEKETAEKELKELKGKIEALGIELK